MGFIIFGEAANFKVFLVESEHKVGRSLYRTTGARDFRFCNLADTGHQSITMSHDINNLYT